MAIRDTVPIYLTDISTELSDTTLPFYLGKSTVYSLASLSGNPIYITDLYGASVEVTTSSTYSVSNSSTTALATSSYNYVTFSNCRYIRVTACTVVVTGTKDYDGSNGEYGTGRYTAPKFSHRLNSSNVYVQTLSMSGYSSRTFSLGTLTLLNGTTFGSHTVGRYWYTGRYGYWQDESLSNGGYKLATCNITLQRITKG